MSLLRTFALPAVTFTLVALSVACSAKVDDGDGTGAPVAADKASFIDQVCQAFSPCCTKAGRTPAMDECKALYTSVLAAQTYDPAKGGACLADLKKLAGTDSFCSGAGPDSSACEGVFQSSGTKKPGETCTKNDECAPSTEGSVECASLYTSAGAEIRKCQVQVAGKLGDTPCVGTVDGDTTSFSSSGTATDVPAKGYLCDVKNGIFCDSASGACKAVGKIGDACGGFDSYACGKDGFCDTATSKCVAKRTAGQPCSGSWNECVATAWCDSAAKTCADKKADGSACEGSQECKSDNCKAGKCGGSEILDFFCK